MAKTKPPTKSPPPREGGLAQSAANRGLDRLVRVLREEDDFARDLAVMALMLFGPIVVNRVAVQLARAPLARQRRRLAAALGSFGRDDPETALRALTAAERDP